VRIGGSWARTLLPAAISTASYDAANRQLTLGGKTMTYDFNGNLATLTESGQTTTYTWDARNRLASLTGPGLTASFVYDARGRRTQKTINAFATDFQYDGVHIIKEIAGGSTVNYLRGLYIDEHLARMEASSTFCYAPDALGSTMAVTDGTGDVSTEYIYEPFGRPVATGAASQNPFQFTGRDYDGSGLYHYRARYYHSGPGRFLSEDPLGLGAGNANLYAYVRGNPINRIDPFGLLDYVGIDDIIDHLEYLARVQGDDFWKDEWYGPERSMLDRLRRGFDTPWDVAFYHHEKAEANRCKEWRHLAPNAYLSMQRQIHDLLEQSQGSTWWDRYHPDVQRRFPDQFRRRP
jgi:RHS repeat-associated protein